MKESLLTKLVGGQGPIGENLIISSKRNAAESDENSPLATVV